MRISDWSSDVCSSDLPENLDRRNRESEPEHKSGQDRQAMAAIRRKRPRDHLLQIVVDGPALANRSNNGCEIVVRKHRSEERRVGEEGGRTGNSRWSPDH